MQMGSIPSELSLDFRASYVPKSINEFLNEVSTIENVPERATKLSDFIRRLEEEMKKIDAFKRELPLCMVLLSDGMPCSSNFSVLFSSCLSSS